MARLRDSWRPSLSAFPNPGNPSRLLHPETVSYALRLIGSCAGSGVLPLTVISEASRTRCVSDALPRSIFDAERLSGIALGSWPGPEREPRTIPALRPTVVGRDDTIERERRRPSAT